MSVGGRGLEGAANVLGRRARLASHRFRAAYRRRWARGDGAPRPDPALLRTLRRPRRLPVGQLRRLRRDTTWPLAPDAPMRSWLESSAQVHERQRATIDAAVGVRSVENVTVLCATARPDNLDALLSNHARIGSPRLVVITNSDRFDLVAVKDRIDAIPGATTIHLNEDESLGSCLNAGLALVTTRFAAKIDDDDWYGERYLLDLLRAQSASAAAVVGKHSHSAHLADRDQFVLRFPGREMAYTSFVAGGTLLLDLEQLGGIRFPSLTVGEDRGLLDAVLAAGLSVFSADRFGYLQHRGDDNTWLPGDTYLRRTVAVDPAQPWGSYDR